MLDVDAFKETMAHVAATVTVVTVDGEDGPVGITVSAFTSVSADPPIVLVCIDKAAASLGAFHAATGYTVNFMSEDAGDIAMLFATKGADKFGESAHRPAALGVGGPILAKAYAHFECEIIRRDEIGDHWVVYGKVLAGGGEDTDPNPLLWVHRSFAKVDSEA